MLLKSVCFQQFWWGFVEQGNRLELTLLHLVGNNAAVAQLLFDHGADLERKDKGLATPLIIAASHDAVEVVKVLLDNSAQLGELAMYLAVNANTSRVIERV